MARKIDEMLRRRLLDRAQHDAATKLRNAWEAAGIGRGPDISEAADEVACGIYAKALAVLPRDERRVVVASVVYDESPVAWGRCWNCDGLALLRRALDRMTRHFRRAKAS